MEDEFDGDEDTDDEDSRESSTEHAMQETNIADLHEFSPCCYSIEEKRLILQFIIIEQEKISVIPDLKAAEFIEIEISRNTKETATDNNIEINTGDVISAKPSMFGRSVAKDIQGRWSIVNRIVAEHVCSRQMAVSVSQPI